MPDFTLVLDAKGYNSPAEADIYTSTGGNNQIAAEYLLSDGYVAWVMQYAVSNTGPTGLFCLNVNGGGTVSGTEMIFYPCNNDLVTANEQFRQPGNTPSGYQDPPLKFNYIVPAIAQSLCLNAKGGEVKSDEVILYACNSADNEAWDYAYY